MKLETVGAFLSLDYGSMKPVLPVGWVYLFITWGKSHCFGNMKIITKPRINDISLEIVFPDLHEFCIYPILLGEYSYHLRCFFPDENDKAQWYSSIQLLPHRWKWRTWCLHISFSTFGNWGAYLDFLLCCVAIWLPVHSSYWPGSNACFLTEVCLSLKPPLSLWARAVLRDSTLAE